MEAKTVYLKDYQAPKFDVVSVHLIFDIQALNQVNVIQEMHVKRQGLGDLHLNGEDLVLSNLFLNDKVVTSEEYQVQNDILTVFNCPNEFHLRIETILNPQSNTALSGLYASRQMLCTQCEAEGFRRITYYLDRPDVLSIYTVKIIASKKDFPLLLSNGNLIESGVLEEGRHYVVWQDPFLKPCYLFALVAGDLARISDEFITMSGRHVGLDIFVEYGDETYCQFAMQAMRDAMRWDEVRFGREYDLDRYMIVATKDFNMGAMENKGLNIFNAKYVLADENTATDDDILAIESVIGHEYFHNWTGNRVTCRDWFQLSLKEGLTIFRDQSFSADMNGEVVQRISDVANLRRVQFPEDRGALAHPVQPKSYQEINNFYTATVYEKGGELVRMQEVLFGREGFRNGMDLYFKRFDGKAVTIEDFIQAIQDANHMPLPQFKRWYDQAGTPEVHVRQMIADGELIVEMTQSCPETADGSEKHPLLIPIRWSVFHRNGEIMKGLPPILLLEKEHQTWRFKISEESILVNYLQGFSAPIILKRSLSMDDMLALICVENDGFALWDLKQKLWIDFIHQIYQFGHMDSLPQALIDTFVQLMKKPLAHDLLAELFRFPSFEECLVGLENVDVEKLYLARLHCRQLLTQAFWSDMAPIYQTLSQNKGEEKMATRAWRHVCLQYLMIAQEALYKDACWQQFIYPRNMTDRISALRILIDAEDSTLRQEAFDQFDLDWHQHELVMDKWFSLQALTVSPTTLDTVEKLIEHPLFSWENPNKVRALIGGFVQNHPCFHAIDGSGYAFLVSCIKILDKINPQIASRMVVPFTRWEWLDKPRRQLIQEALRSLKSEELSPDVFEMVDKSIVN
ncbi:MAG: aminopeptidase N [Gammaproteobacteria bacterium]|nr:aminopeptidase N [Gammaproteobacteria bacterium]